MTNGSEPDTVASDKETANDSETFPRALEGAWIGSFFPSIKDLVCIINVIRFPYRRVYY